MESQVRVSVSFKSRTALLRSFFQHGDDSGIFVPGYLEVAVGKRIALRIAIPSLDHVFDLHGILKWKRHQASKALPAGVGIAFAHEDRTTTQMLIDTAEGRDVTLIKRRSTRVPVGIHVAYKTGSAFLHHVTEDLSKEGAFIRTTEALPVGTMMHLKLDLPGRFWPLKLSARVTQIKNPPAHRGVGVVFEFKNDRAREKFEKIVAEIRSDVVRELKFEL